MVRVEFPRSRVGPPCMSFQTSIRVLLTVAIVMISTVGAVHGASHAARSPASIGLAIEAQRAADNGCSSSTQTHCHMLAVALVRSTRSHRATSRAARLSAKDDPDRSGLEAPLEERPPRYR